MEKIDKMDKRLLFSLAHPDDESFSSGGLIAKYVRAGVQVDYILGTDGGKGTIREEFLQQYGSIKATRQAEMDCAANTLGFKQVYWLNYGDSGMMGSPDNDDPACLWQADEGEVAAKIKALLAEVRPQVVVTFDPYGAYGHPDHIFMHRATTRAFHELRAESPATAPQKLYYTVFPRLALRFFIWQTRLRGGNPRQVGVNKDLDLVAILEHGLPITTQVDIQAYFEDWDRASACHASQTGPRQNMPHWQRRLLMSKQSLTRAYPPWRPGEKRESDLFEGLP